jgi:hypothetical protein
VRILEHLPEGQPGAHRLVLKFGKPQQRDCFSCTEHIVCCMMQHWVRRHRVKTTFRFPRRTDRSWVTMFATRSLAAVLKCLGYSIFPTRIDL